MTEFLDCVVVEPGAEIAAASVIWLHGLGADGHDFEAVVPLLGIPPEMDVRFLFPNAPAIPVTVNNGIVMPAWYDILGMDFDRRVDEEGVRRSAQHVTDLIERERERGVAPEKIVLAGFSQGGAIALHLGLRYEARLAGILALSTYIACDGDLENERSDANQDVPIFQALGTMDPMVAYGLGTRARTRLTDLGYSVDWHEYEMQHQVCPEEIDAVGAWLRRVLDLA